MRYPWDMEGRMGRHTQSTLELIEKSQTLYFNSPILYSSDLEYIHPIHNYLMPMFVVVTHSD